MTTPLQEQKPDFGNQLFKIEIISSQLGQIISVVPISPNPHPSVPEIVGALELMKQKLIWDQNKESDKKDLNQSK